MIASTCAYRRCYCCRIDAFLGSDITVALMGFVSVYSTIRHILTPSAGYNGEYWSGTVSIIRYALKMQDMVIFSGTFYSIYEKVAISLQSLQNT